MSERRRYTKRQKVEAVAQATMTSTEAASDRLGIPRRTLGYWTTLPEFAELRQKTRDGVVDMFWAAIQIGVDQVAQGLLDPDAPLRDKATALGILYDKHALLTGDVTTRSEHRDISDPDDAGLDVLEQVLSAGRETQTPVAVVIGSNGTHTNGKH